MARTGTWNWEPGCKVTWRYPIRQQIGLFLGPWGVVGGRMGMGEVREDGLGGWAGQRVGSLGWGMGVCRVCLFQPWEIG